MTGRKSWIMIMISFAHKTQSTQWSLNMQILPQSSVSALVVSGRGPLDACVAAKNAEETRLRGPGPGLAETRDKTPHLIQTRVTSDCLHYTVYSVQCGGAENTLTLDTTLVGGEGAAETLWQFPRGCRIQTRWPGENVRHGEIHHPGHSCLRAQDASCDEAGCMRGNTLCSSPCLSGQWPRGKWANSQLTIEQSFFIGPGFRNFIFFFFSTQQLWLKGWASQRKLKEADWAEQ